MRRICLFILCFLFSVVPVLGPAAESVSMPAALDYTAINKQLDKMAKSLSSNKATPAETVPMLDDLDGFYNQINQAVLQNTGDLDKLQKKLINSGKNIQAGLRL